MKYRSQQLSVRTYELLTSIEILLSLLSDPSSLAQHTTRRSPHTPGILSKQPITSLPTSFFSCWTDNVDLNEIWLAGHSFGGGTCLSLLSQVWEAKSQGRDILPEKVNVQGVIILDPWLEPLIDSDPNSHQKLLEIKTPMMVINSPGFTAWEPHFGWLRDLVKGARNGSQEGKAWLVTLGGIQHTTFSDFGIFGVFSKFRGGASTYDAILAQKAIHSISVEFLDLVNQGGDVKEGSVLKKEEYVGEVDEELKKTLKGGDWLVSVKGKF
jgi:pimeloyl-ACP methyl ester carboxylesterase